MDFLDVRLPIFDRPIIVAGVGALADAVVSRLGDAEIRRLTDSHAFDAAAYVGGALAIVASDDDIFAQAAARAARAAELLVCAEGRPALSDFALANIVMTGPDAAPDACVAEPLTASIEEIAPAAAPDRVSPDSLGDRMAAFLDARPGAEPPAGAGRIAALLQRVHDRHLDAEDGERREALQEILRGPAAQAAADGDMDLAERHVLAALERFREESAV